MSNIPLWADASLSAKLPDIRAAGEGAKVEFKVDFPAQAHDLAKELAALGTSGGGALYIGINDAGEPIGLKAIDGDSRDALVRRAQGIVNTVRPNLRVDILLAVDGHATILAIVVPVQEEPFFYHEHRPYIRDGRHSRPANPDEVKERVWSHPSSEHKREIERLRLQQAQDLIDAGRRSSEAMSAIR